jgi:hypothetical protein
MCVDAEYLMEKVMEVDGERCEGFYVAIGWTITMIFMTRMGRGEINLIVSNEIRLGTLEKCSGFHVSVARLAQSLKNKGKADLACLQVPSQSPNRSNHFSPPCEMSHIVHKSFISNFRKHLPIGTLKPIETSSRRHQR